MKKTMQVRILSHWNLPDGSIAEICQSEIAKIERI